MQNYISAKNTSNEFINTHSHEKYRAGTSMFLISFNMLRYIVSLLQIDRFPGILHK